MSKPAPSIYDYTDFRSYLRAWFEAHDGRPSVRGFARRAHCSPSLVSAVLHDRRSLGLERAERWAQLLHLDEEERRYLLALVTLEEAHSTEQREQAFERVTAARRFRSAARLTEDTYALLSRWYIGATLELARCEGWTDDPAWIAGALHPPVDESVAREALDVLESMGALVRDAEGRLVPADDLWSTGHQTPPGVVNLALFKQHHSVLELATQALDTLPAEERNFSTLTFALPDAAVAEIRARIHRFHEDLIRLLSAAPGPPQRVWHLGVQLFPMSRGRAAARGPVSDSSR